MQANEDSNVAHGSEGGLSGPPQYKTVSLTDQNQLGIQMLNGPPTRAALPISRSPHMGPVGFGAQGPSQLPISSQSPQLRPSLSPQLPNVLPQAGLRQPFQHPNPPSRAFLPHAPALTPRVSPFVVQQVQPLTRPSTPSFNAAPNESREFPGITGLPPNPLVRLPGIWPGTTIQARPPLPSPSFARAPFQAPVQEYLPQGYGNVNQGPASFTPPIPGIQRLPRPPMYNNPTVSNGTAYPLATNLYNGNSSEVNIQGNIAFNEVPNPPPSNYQPPMGGNVSSYQQPIGGNVSKYQPPMGGNLRMPQPNNIDGLNTQFGQMGVTGAGFNKLWGTESIDLLSNRIILPPEGVTPPAIKLQNEYLNRVNCSSEIVQCTLTKFPETKSLLEKSRLPLGLLFHPFKDLQQLPVITCQNITRCRTCRTYVNPFVYFVDQRRWKCNLCFRVNELPDDFLVEPSTKQYGDPSKRPEVLNATIEYIAPAEYMLRAPPPATYVYLLEATMASLESGYLRLFCNTLMEELERIPGDTRAQFAFITFGSSIHFHCLEEGTKQPRMIVVNDINEMFLPTCEGLLAKRSSCKDLIENLLEILPSIVEEEARGETGGNCLGPALQTASKLVWSTGGRISVFLATLPTVGPGALKPRGQENTKGSKDVGLLAPAVDFYKSMALENNGQHIAVDVFFLGSQYQDVASIACVSKYTSGCLYRFPNFHSTKNPLETQRFESILRRYLTRKIGFESVMRVRCTRGLSIHTFHGNLFVRSTDLLALANVNPDAGFGMQVSIEESLSDMTSVCFQAAVLYTSSKGERRIRVHTVCLPLASTVADIIAGADQQCIIGLLAKIAVERSLTSSITDARDAFINAAADPLTAYKALQNLGSGQLLAPPNLKLLPMYILAMLKTVAFRDIPTQLDDRVFDMCEMKSLPLSMLIQHIYPDLYEVHQMEDEDPPRIHLSSERVNTTGVYLMDAGSYIFILIGRTSPVTYCRAVFDVDDPRQVETSYELPMLNTAESKRLHAFVDALQNEKPCSAAIQIFRDDAPQRVNFFNRLVEDRGDLGLGYFEFLQQLKTRVK